MTTRPDPRAMTGTYDTSETGGAGAPHADLRGVAAAFDIAAAGDLAYALRSMNEDDLAVPPNLVQTSPGLTVNRGDPDGDRQRITRAAERARANLNAAGLDVDPVTGAVHTVHTQAWQNHAKALGAMTQVEENTDRSAG